MASVLAALLYLAIGWAALPPALAADELCAACLLAQVSPRLQAPQLQGRFARVPDVKGLPRAEAERVLRAANLVLAEGGQRPGQDRPDIVLEQTPAPDTVVPLGSRVTVILSTPRAEPPRLVAVPDVRGKPTAGAERILKAADLGMTEGDRRPSPEPPGTVLEQSPAPGTQVRRGASVTVIVSTPSPTVRVPDVRGRSRAEAARILRGADFAYVEGDRRPSTGRSDVVLEQDPRPGAAATRGSAVTVILSTPAAEPPPLIPVPDVRGRSQAEARQRLQGEGLVLSVGGRQESREPADVVLQQEPPPGAQVRRGTTVTVTLSTPVSTITTPDVIGRTRPDAEQILGGRSCAWSRASGDRAQDVPTSYWSRTRGRVPRWRAAPP
jgi:eukaryotic-like serine/threonine-protein kinase